MDPDRTPRGIAAWIRAGSGGLALLWASALPASCGSGNAFDTCDEPPCDGETGLTPCEDEQDCDGDVCSEALGACVECVADGDCDEQQECIGNTCIGFVPCNEPDDCPTNQVCNEETERCVECVDDGDCGDEQTCIGERCRDACEDSDDCESGTQCQDELGACVDCLDAGDCDESSYCSATGECEPDVCIAGAQACDGVDIVECNADGSAEEPYRSCEDGVCEASGGSASCEAGTEPEPPTNSCGVRGVADAPDLAKAEPAPFDGRDAAESTAAALDDIDNFADGDLGLLAVNGRSGGWFTIGVPDGSISEPTIVTTGTDYAVEVSGNRDADETTALLAASLNHPEGESAGVYDVSFQPDVTFTGVSVWAAGTPGLALRLKLSTLEGIPISDGGLCDETYGPCRDFLGATITLDGEFRRHDVAFDDLVQEGWGQALSGDLTRVRALEFHPAVGSFNFAIDRVALVADSLTASPDLRLNQLGYFSDGPKRAVVVGGSETSFSVVEAASGDAVFTDSLSAAGSWAPAGESAKLADFSELSDPGTYYLRVGDDVSETFAVRNDLLSDLTRGLVKAYYFNRASEALAAAHADAYARPAGHPDTSVVVHATAGSASRPAGNTFSAPGGWYDAGDYGKYIVSSSIATTTLLLAYDHHADVLDDLSTRIPESGNEAPDVLNEARYNLEWMLAMQDPGDGGVHHMLVTEDFPGEDTMPNEDTGVRYAMAKTTSAALDFAATLAHAARTFAPFDEEFSCTALAAAIAAFAWAERNPAVVFPAADVAGGPYEPNPSGDYDGEFFWAAAELYVTTGGDDYRQALEDRFPASVQAPSWTSVQALGAIALSSRSLAASALAGRAEDALVARADALKAAGAASAFGVPLDAFYWGSNGELANRGLVLLVAYRITDDASYLAAAVDAADYLLGRNAIGTSFVTGFGEVRPLSPHHRPSTGDGVAQPVPGWLVGGPNPNGEDVSAECSYATTPEAKSWYDDVCSFATNEVAINWNAPAAYLMAGLESALGE